MQACLLIHTKTLLININTLKSTFSVQVRLEVVIDIIGEMKCYSQFQQIIQMSYITFIISEGT